MAINPANYGMPDATTAGVQAGVSLKTYNGPMTITQDGAVIENVIINGTLTIDADNVTIKNCVIQNFGYWGVLQNDGVKNVRVEYCDIDGTGSTRTSGLGVGGGSNAAIIGCDIRGMVIGIQLFGAATVKDNYIHNLADTSTNIDDRHFDGITLFAGGGNVIEHNTIMMPTNNGGTAAVFIKTEFGSIDNVTVRNNLMTGDPSYTVYVEDTDKGNITNVLVENNYVERGGYGYFNIVGNSPVVRNNIMWQDGVDAAPAATISSAPSSSSPQPAEPVAPSTPSPVAPSAPSNPVKEVSDHSGGASKPVFPTNHATKNGDHTAVPGVESSNKIGSHGFGNMNADHGSASASTGGVAPHKAGMAFGEQWAFHFSSLSNASSHLDRVADHFSSHSSFASSQKAAFISSYASSLADALSGNFGADGHGDHSSHSAKQGASHDGFHIF